MEILCPPLSLQAPGGLLESLVSLGFYYLTLTSAFILTWSCVCVCACLPVLKLPPFGEKRKPVVLDLGPTLSQYDFSLSDDMCGDSISKEGHIPRYQGLILQHSNWAWRGHIHPVTVTLDLVSVSALVK